MRTIKLLISCMVIANTTYSQDADLKWAIQMAGGGNSDAGMSVKADALGNVYATGYFMGTVDFDAGPGVFNLTSTSATANDIYISKSDADGDLIWVKQIGGAGDDESWTLIIDAANNIYVSGYFSSTVDFDPGTGTYNITALSNLYDMFILKLLANGNFNWVKRVGNSGETYIRCFSIDLDSFGNIYLTGEYWGSVDFNPGPGIFNITSQGFTDFFILKLDAAGNFIWVRSLGASNFDDAYSITIDNADDIYVTGRFEGSMDFDPGPAVYSMTCVGFTDLYVLKLDDAGNFVWARSIGAAEQENGVGIASDPAGNIYVTGFFELTVDFDPALGVFNLTSNGMIDFYILKLDANGNFVWARAIGGPVSDFAHSIVLDNLGNIYTTGYFEGNVDFDPGPGIFLLNGNGNSDIYILKLDNNGNFVWAKSMGAAGIDEAFSIFVDVNDNVYTTGHFTGTVDFNPGTGIYNLTAADPSNIFIQKLKKCLGETYAVITESACNAYTLNSQTYTTSGTYIQTITNTAGCDSIITLNLAIHAQTLTTVNPSICQGQFYYAGGANQTSSGIYKDTLQTIFGCDSIIITNLTVSLPNPDLGSDRKLCTSSTAAISPGMFSSYLWQDNSTQPDLHISGMGKYWVTVTDANNCSATDTVNILGIDTIPVNFLPADQQLCYGNVLNIHVPGYKDYLWNTGSVSNNLPINNFGIYYLSVTDYNNCIGTDSIIIDRKNCVYIGIPNAFTPNKDGKNDIFKPTINQAVKQFSFIVFNRYGEKIFETGEYGKGWDGTYKGKDQPVGSYVYHIKFTNIFGWESLDNGTVLLLR